MEIQLTRQRFYQKDTIGRLVVDGDDYCYTLEDRVRTLNSLADKVAGETAIPWGRYQVVIDFSQRFQRKMPHILDVPFFDGIRIHPGNTDEDTEGCILLGMTFDPAITDFVGQSRVAFDEFFANLEQAIALGEKAWITITEEPILDERT